MAVLYIREQGTTVTKDGGRIRIMRGGRPVLEHPLIGIDSIAIFGNVQFTAQAVQLVLDAGIDIDYFSFSGKYLGRLAADASKNIFLRMRQYDLYMKSYLSDKTFHMAEKGGGKCGFSFFAARAERRRRRKMLIFIFRCPGREKKAAGNADFHFSPPGQREEGGGKC